MFTRRLLSFRWVPVGLSRSVSRAQSKTLGMSWRRFNSTQVAPKPKGIKGLMQLYGYSALGVYLVLTAVDLPLCFLMVHSLGEEKIKVYLNRVKNAFGYGIEEEEVVRQVKERLALKEEKERTGALDELSWWESFKQSTLLAEFLIAYGIHKSLIILRLPLTAAITPPTVKLLQKWGFKIGNPKMLKTLAQDAKIRYKSGKSNDFVNPNSAGTAFPKQKHTKGQKWFNGLM